MRYPRSRERHGRCHSSSSIPAATLRLRRSTFLVLGRSKATPAAYGLSSRQSLDRAYRSKVCSPTLSILPATWALAASTQASLQFTIPTQTTTAKVVDHLPLAIWDSVFLHITQRHRVHQSFAGRLDYWPHACFTVDSRCVCHQRMNGTVPLSILNRHSFGALS